MLRQKGWRETQFKVLLLLGFRGFYLIGLRQHLSAMSDGSPLIAHTIPWTAMGVSLGLAAILFVAALKVARTREY